MKQIAFWTYDLYPFTLWGEINEKRVHPYDARLKYIPSYQSYFEPFLVLNKDAAQELIKELKELESEYNKENKKIKDLFRAKLIEVIPENPSF